MRGGCRCPRVALPDDGDWSLWIEVGSLMDTFMPGTWTIANVTMPGQDGTPLNQSGASFAVQFGLRKAGAGAHVPIVEHSTLHPEDGDGVTVIAEKRTNGVSIQFNFDPNTRATRLMNGVDADLVAIMAALNAQTASLHGTPPKAFPIYANAYGGLATSAVAQRFYDSDGDTPLFTSSAGVSVLEDTSKNKAMTTAFQAMFQQQPLYPSVVTAANPRALVYMRAAFHDPAFSAGLKANGTISVIIYDKYLNPAKNLFKNSSCNSLYGERVVDAEAVLAVDIGDESNIPFPDTFGINASVIDAIFVIWLRTKRKLTTPALAGCAGTEWSECSYMIRHPKGEPEVLSGPRAKLFFYSGLFARDWGLEVYRNVSAPMQKAWVNAGIGFNQQTPFTSLRTCAPVFQWIRAYREGALSLPWVEHWSWSTPLGTQQMQQLALDAFRSGMRDRQIPHNTLGVWSGAPPIHCYVLPHVPGNTAASWRRQFYADINHGLKQLNLFIMAPFVQIGGPNAVDTWDNMSMYLEVRKSLSELGLMEDIVLHGTALAFGADVAMLFSESTEIMSDMATPINLLGRTGTSGVAQRCLYIALRHLRHPVDIIIEEDCVPVILDRYHSVYVSDQNLVQSAARGLRTWLQGDPTRTLWASAGGGMLDEFNETNPAMLDLFGLQSYAITRQDTIQFVKQDLAFVPRLEQVSVVAAANSTIGVYGTLASMVLNNSLASTTTLHARFSDSRPAVLARKMGPKGGTTVLCAFHPSLSYFHQAIPPRPTERGSTDENFNHFVPSDFDLNAKALIALGTAALPAPPTLASDPLIETGVITAPGKGSLIPLIDWSGRPSSTGVIINLTRSLAFDTVALASGAAVAVSADKRSFVLAELKIADAIILRL